MKYFRVPITNGIIAISDYSQVIHSLVVDTSEALVQVQDGTELSEGWLEIAEAEWNLAFKAAALTVDKPSIIADGVDSAVITATCPAGLAELTFYVDGEPITRPVTQGVASLEITADIPGQISIIAGIAPLKNIVNEVVIHVH